MENLEFYEIYNNFNNVKIDFENPINTLIKINGLFIKNGLRKDRN